MALAAMGLMVAFFVMFAPMMEPKLSLGTQVGEIAGEIKRSAWRSFLGLPTETAAPTPPKLWEQLYMVGPVLGVLAIVLAVVSALRGEPKRLALTATGLGIAAITLPVLWWFAMLVAAVILLVAILNNLSEIFSL